MLLVLMSILQTLKNWMVSSEAEARKNLRIGAQGKIFQVRKDLWNSLMQLFQAGLALRTDQIM